MQKDDYIIEEEYDPQSRFDNIHKFENKFWENKSLEEYWGNF